jgi:hypothetical protein
MKPDISEFSYGFALTYELILTPGFPIVAAPVFPSLYQEGKAGGGWDVRLDRPGVPLFLQFKLSDCLQQRNSKEAAALGCPYYRMHLRPSRHSDQHALLLALESSGEEVYYVAPSFHTVAELNEAYRSRSVSAGSRWFPPSCIGALPDDKDHYVSFKNPGPMIFRSTPRLLGDGATFFDFGLRLERAISQRGAESLAATSLTRLAAVLEGLTAEGRRTTAASFGQTRDWLHDRPPLEQIAYYSSVFLEAQLFIASRAAV